MRVGLESGEGGCGRGWGAEVQVRLKGVGSDFRVGLDRLHQGCADLDSLEKQEGGRTAQDRKSRNQNQQQNEPPL